MRIRRPRPDAAAAGDRRRERRGPAAAGRSRAGGASKRGRRRPAACGPGGPREQDARSALRRRAAAGRHCPSADRSSGGRPRRRADRKPRFGHPPVGDGASHRGRQRAGSSRGPGDPRSSGREARPADRGPAFGATGRHQGSPRSAGGREMTLWLAAQTIRRAPRRLVLAALRVAFPVSILAADLLFVYLASNSMTQIALAPVQLEMRALATTLDVNLSKIDRKLAAVPAVSHVDRFASANVFVGTPGGGRVTARLFAVDPSYFGHHPWARVVRGSLTRGALLDQGLRASPGFRSASRVSIELPGARRRLGLSLPVAGTVDLRQALTTSFGIPPGTVQGDVALVPRAIVVNYRTFRRSILPALRAELGPTTPVLDPGLTDLPPVSVESHVSIDHRSYPSDPGRAVTWTNGLRHILETQAPGKIVVSDLAVEQLTEASADAANAKTLFLLLGIPGALVAAALGLAAQSALTEASRREDALLRLRGATDRQLALLAIAQTGAAALVGSVIGVLVAITAVSAVTGQWGGPGGPAPRLPLPLPAAGAPGVLASGVRLARLLRGGKRLEIAERRRLQRGWTPT